MTSPDLAILADLRTRYAVARLAMQTYAADAAWWYGAMLEADAHRERDRLAMSAGVAARHAKLVDAAYREMNGLLVRIRCMEADQWRTMSVDASKEQT